MRNLEKGIKYLKEEIGKFYPVEKITTDILEEKNGEMIFFDLGSKPVVVLSIKNDIDFYALPTCKHDFIQYFHIQEYETILNNLKNIMEVE